MRATTGQTGERSQPDVDVETGERVTPDEKANPGPSVGPSAAPSDPFLVPGPTAESNENLGRWGCSWLMFSIALMVLMAAMSWVCLVLARWANLA
jgi:hypothetical protein